MEQVEQHSRIARLIDRLFPKHGTTPETLSPREEQVVSLVRQIQTPFITALQEEYGADNGWQLCGPAAIALSRILSSKLGIPISREGEGEHMELYLGIYNPGTNNIVGEELTYIKYFSGNGYVLYIDPTYRLLTHKAADSSDNPILVEKFAQDEFDQQLIKRHNIYPFDPNNDVVKSRGGITSVEQVSSFWQDVMTTIHDYRGTMPILVTSEGKKKPTNWHKAVNIIKRFAPEWQEDAKSQERDYARLLADIQGRSPLIRPKSISDLERLKLIKKEKGTFY